MEDPVSDPVSELSDDARALLTRVRENAKGERAASPAALARVRRNVLSKVRVSVAVGAAGTTLAVKAAAAPAAPAGVWLLAAKTLGGLAVVGAITAGGVALDRQLNAPPDAPVSNVHPSTVRPSTTIV